MPADRGPQAASGEADLAALLAGLEPELDPVDYMFVSVREVPPGISPFAVIREEEGLTLVVSQAEAAAAGLPDGWAAERITLRVNSALDAVGLTAAVSTRLADAGISCNVIAGYRHDHLFVPAGRGGAARRLLAS